MKCTDDGSKTGQNAEQDSLGSIGLTHIYVQATQRSSGCTGESNMSTNTVSVISYLTGPQQV